MIEPKGLTVAAVENFSATEAEIEFDVAAAIGANDLHRVWMLVPQLAALDAAKFGAIKADLRQKFKTDLCVRDFDLAIKAERAKLRRPKREEQFTGPLPEIQVNARPMRDVSADSLQALRRANQTPQLFVRSGQMVYVASDERQRPSICSSGQDHLRGRLDRSAEYLRRGENGDMALAPPMDVVKDILALPCAQWGLPPLDVVVEVPTLREDGTVLDEPGYDHVSRMLYQPAPDLAMRPVPPDPTTDEVDAAVALIDEAIGDFPFLEAASRANCFGMLLTPIMRPAIAGCTPLAIIDAPQAGTGKSLLVDVFSIITTGRPAAMMPFPREDVEMEKRIGSTLLQGRSLVCFDNMVGVLSSPALCLALTAKEYETRILGVSENMVAPNRATWLLTGNNVRPSGDMPRRCYHIRLDAKSSRPYTGREFKHANLLEWVRDNRSELLRALLIIARACFTSRAMDRITNPLGSFEDWNVLVGGALRNAGVEGFLGNSEAWLTKYDEEALQWETLLSQLAAAYPDGEEFTVAAVASEISSASLMMPSRFTLPDSLADVDTRKVGGLSKSLGKTFAARLGRRFGSEAYHLEREMNTDLKVWKWRVQHRG